MPLKIKEKDKEKKEQKEREKQEKKERKEQEKKEKEERKRARSATNSRRLSPGKPKYGSFRSSSQGSRGSRASRKSRRGTKATKGRQKAGKRKSIATAFQPLVIAAGSPSLTSNEEREYSPRPAPSSASGSFQSGNAQENPPHSHTAPGSKSMDDRTKLNDGTHTDRKTLAPSDARTARSAKTASTFHTYQEPSSFAPSAASAKTTTDPSGPDPVWAHCNYCSNSGMTIVDQKRGKRAWKFFFILLFVFAWPFCIIPLFCKSCFDHVHTCPVCKATLSQDGNRKEDEEKVQYPENQA